MAFAHKSAVVALAARARSVIPILDIQLEDAFARPARADLGICAASDSCITTRCTNFVARFLPCFVVVRPGPAKYLIF